MNNIAIYLDDYLSSRESSAAQIISITDETELIFRVYSVSSDSVSGQHTIIAPQDLPPGYLTEFVSAGIGTNITIQSELLNDIEDPPFYLTYDVSPSASYIEYVSSLPDSNNYVYYDPSNPSIIKIKNLLFEDNITYIFTFSSSAVSGLVDSVIRLRFTNSYKYQEFISTFTNILSDVVSKMNNLGDLLDVDTVLLKSDERFNFEYHPIEYDSAKQDYREVSELLQIDNASVIETLFISQYLNDYVNYFTDISNADNRSVNSLLTTRQEIQQLKVVIAKNAHLFNQCKGVKTGIEYVFGIFADALGYELISISLNQYRNFSYTITTSLPIKYWLKDIKPIIHPIPWAVKYDVVPPSMAATAPNVNFSTYYRLYKDKFYPTYRKNSPNYLEYTYNDTLFSASLTAIKNLNLNVFDSGSTDECRFVDVGYDYEYNIDQAKFDIMNEYPFNLKTEKITDSKVRLVYTSAFICPTAYRWRIYENNIKLVDTQTVTNHIFVDINNINEYRLELMISNPDLRVQFNSTQIKIAEEIY